MSKANNDQLKDQLKDLEFELEAKERELQDALEALLVAKQRVQDLEEVEPIPNVWI